jgi:hypothetical protein
MAFRAAVLFWALPLVAAAPARFEAHTIATGLRGGYQTLVADVNGDGKPDIIALGQNMSELVWYEGPTWEPHVLAKGQSQMVNCVLVASGELVLASGFSNKAADSAGIISVLRRGPDVRQPWTATEIDRLPTSHRLRVAHVDSGAPIVVNAPLTAADAEAPNYRRPVPLVYYRSGEWKRQLISDKNQGIMHGLLVTGWDGDGFDDILTASFGGIDLFHMRNDGRWTRTGLAAGDPAPWPKSGSSDIAVGTLDGVRFLAAIEPWHGNQVVFYRLRDGKWQRRVIDDSFVDGHALLTADLNGDSKDEIVASYRNQGSVYIYSAQEGGDRWTRYALDEGMSAASCAAADLNGDGRPDLVCIEATRLRWYENKGPASN